MLPMPRRTALLLLPLLPLLAATAAQAANLSVSVNGADGRPAADVVVLATPTAAWTPQPLPPPALIAQQDIRFTPYVTVLPVGASVRFINRDRFDHHIRSLPGGPLGSTPPAKNFEFRLAGARGNTQPSAEVKLDLPGQIVLGCHLHGSMRGHVVVASTPWTAVTDASGRATISGIPDGQAELRLWHPDQLVDQAAQRLQLAGEVAAQGQLNFSPRRIAPPAPRPKGEYEY